MNADPSIGMSPEVPPPPVHAGIRTILLASDLSRVGMKWTPVLHPEDPLAPKR